MRVAPLSLVVVVNGLAGCDALFGLAHIASDERADAADASMADAFVVPHCSGSVLGPPVEIGELTGRALADPELRNDQLEVYWEGSGDVYRATRTSTTQPFIADASPLPFNDPVDDDESPEVDLDGNLLVFLSKRGGSSGWRAWYVERDGNGLFSPAQLVPGLESVAMGWLDLSYDGLLLYYVDGAHDLHQVTRQARNQAFTNDSVIGSNVQSLTISADSLELYYRQIPATNMPEIWYARRASIVVPFPAGAKVLDGYYDPDLTPDGKHLIVDGPFVLDRMCP